MLPRSSLCMRVMSCPKLSNITNSMQYSSLWMCLQWVCWIILLNKCVPRANSKNMVLNRGRKYNPTDCCGSEFIMLSVRFCVCSSYYTYRTVICHLDTFLNQYVYSRSGKDSTADWVGVVGKMLPYRVSVCFMFIHLNSLTDCDVLSFELCSPPILHNVLSVKWITWKLLFFIF